jgi:hypothetical protein
MRMLCWQARMYTLTDSEKQQKKAVDDAQEKIERLKELGTA